MDSSSDTPTDSTLESSFKSEDDDPLDPRVQIELERLNHANEAINHLEVQLDEARYTQKELWDAAEAELSRLEKKIGAAVGKARSYYDARIKLRDAKETLTKAKHRFERAQALHVAAKELAVVSVDYIDEAKKSNENATTWKDTYRHAIIQAADAEREKYQSDLDQQRVENEYYESENLVEKLQKEFRRSINKSQPYYEMKAEYHKELDFQKRKVYALENCVSEAKSQYHESLKNLERISNEIHEQRNRGKSRRELGERTAGVGEEQLIHTESKQASLTPVQVNTPTLTPTITAVISRRASHCDEVLRSCLLRTEALPAGIFANTIDRYSPEGDEATTIIHDQFILCSKQQPPDAAVINKSDNDTKILINNSLQRLESYSSQMNDEEDKTGSLHVLSDEQLSHLASVYHPFPANASLETGMHEKSFEQSNNLMFESVLY